jgi:hypothetical protein
MKLGEARSIGILVAIVGAWVGCGGSKPSTPQCSLNSDCIKASTPGLVCALGYCVTACKLSSDCPNGERCVNVTKSGEADAAAADGGMSLVAVGTNCEAPELSTCSYNHDCVAPLVCSSDHQCRDQCQTDVDCPMQQVCTSMTHLCADPTVDKDYNAAINDFVVNDAGMGIPQGGNTGTGTGGKGAGSGTGGSGSGGHSGSGGSGTAVNSCPSPQTSFGNIALGDANPAFTSGIGVRDGDSLYVFSGYVAPPSDAGNAGSNSIYVQAFDPATGNSKGPAALLAQTADGPSFGVSDVSVAPTGEIAILHSRASAVDSYQNQLYVSFLAAPAAQTDAGAAGLTVVKTVQLESINEGDQHVVWSVANAAFIISWKYDTTGWFARVRRFLPDGRSAGGDTSPIPVPANLYDPQSSIDSQVGTSGSLLGVSYDNYPTNRPFLTILGPDGLQVGDLVPLAPNTGVVSWVSVGGTTRGFVTLFNGSGSTVNGVFVPISGSTSVITDAGASVDAGDGGIAKDLVNFSIPSNATNGKIVSDDTGGLGGVGAVLLESEGANFIYVAADASKRLVSGAVISSSHGAQVGLSNYHGSFALSLYDSTTHATQVVASGCSP